MAPNPKPRQPTVRQQVIWETIDQGQVTIVRETYVQTGEYCLACGRRGTWAADPREAPDDTYRMCPSCGTVYELNNGPYRASDVWAEIIRQLQLAEAAAA